MESRKLSRAIIITGTPGTGKTTLSARLAEALSFNHIDVSIFVEREGLYRSIDRARGSKIVKLNRLRSRLKELLKEVERGVVFSSHIPDVLPKRLVKYVIVLRMDPKALFKRLVSMGWSEAKVKENVASEVLGSCVAQALNYYGERRVYELDVTSKSLEDLIKEAFKIVTGRIEAKTSIDWLAKVDEDEELAELLKSL